MSFLLSFAASSVNTPSIAGSSSLLPLLLQSSTLALEFVQTPEGAAFLAKMLEGSLDPAHPSHIPHTPGSSEKEPTAAQGTQRADKLPFSHFVRLVRSASLPIRTLPVIAIESYQHGGKNAGLLPHRYSLLTVLHPTGGPPTYIKLHMRAIQGTLASVLTAELADDCTALVRPTDRRLASLSSTSTSTSTSTGASQDPHSLPQGPSLDALAALLDIVDKRVGKYDVRARNCLWLADLVLFGCARKFRAHWLARDPEPDGLARAQWFPNGAVGAYLRGETDVMTATTRCFLPEGWPGWLGSTCVVLGPVFGAFDMQHEVEDVVGKWRDFVGAAVSPAGVGVAPGDAPTY